MGALPDAWPRARERMESRVMPGRIMSSRGGVTSSTPAGQRSVDRLRDAWIGEERTSAFLLER